MRIVGTHVAAVAAAFPRPLLFRERPMTVNTAVVVHLEDASGAVGLGYAPTFEFATAALRTHVAADFAPLIVDIDLSSAADAVAIMVGAASIAGRPAGLARQAMAILELALWDVEGQLAGLPLHRLWGQKTETVRAYASGGWRYLPVVDLTRQARQWAHDGFGAIKVQVGLSPAEDVARLRAVREAIGPDIGLMADANQRVPSETAVDWAQELSSFGLDWLEEPLPAESHEPMARLRQKTTTPIAAGESETEPSGLEDLLEREAVDVIQPDVHRVGISAARAVAAQAARTNTMVSPHMAHELSAHLMSGSHNGGWLEYFDWFEDWWESPVVHRTGSVQPAATPGHGLRLRPGWLEAHTIT
jgi:L-alanine-DL-glutamate epimerase-like enolase superfamily enzyme